MQSLSLHLKDNTANVTTTGGVKYTVGYPDGDVSQLTQKASADLQPGNFDVQPKTSNGWLSLLTYVLPFVIFIGFWIFLMNQVQGGGSKVMSFGKSRAKRMSVDSPKITFRDVAGVDEAVEELHEIKEFLENPEEIPGPWGSHPQGRPAVRPTGDRQDAAGAGGGRRGRRTVLQHQRVGLRRDVRRRRRQPRA